MSENGDADVRTACSNSRLDSWVKQRTINWVKSVTELSTSDNVTDEQDSFTSNYEDCDDPDDPTEEMSTTNTTFVTSERHNQQHVVYKCEWIDCSFSIEKEKEFYQHVSKHKPVLELRDGEDDKEKVKVWCCLWDSCGFDSETFIGTVRHVNYHAYHTKIKNVGSVLLKTLQLPECMLDYEGRNLLPVINQDYICQWEDCTCEFNSAHSYFMHVRCHVNSLPRGEKNRPLTCEWRGCNKKVKSYSKAVDHIRTHTQEKLVGCPTCGGLFTNKTKFQNHCQRQKERKRFKCSHCQKLYATEKLLRVHIKVHVNKYKCPMCDQVCLYPSSLSTHIRYRHLDHKPFKCNFCEHRSVTEADLETHQLTHCSDNFWVCEQENCDFSGRSKCGLKYHTRIVHGKETEKLVYKCHLCSSKFRVGEKLTKHLKKVHNFMSANDGTRFRYIHGVNGNYTFQTQRYASIEVIREMTNKDKTIIEQNMNRKYTVTIDSKKSSIVIRELTENNLDDKRKKKERTRREEELEMPNIRNNEGECSRKRIKLEEVEEEENEREIKTEEEESDVEVTEIKLNDKNDEESSRNNMKTECSAVPDTNVSLNCRSNEEESTSKEIKTENIEESEEVEVVKTKLTCRNNRVKIKSETVEEGEEDLDVRITKTKVGKRSRKGRYRKERIETVDNDGEEIKIKEENEAYDSNVELTSDNSDDFGDKLKNYLGLTGSSNFIKVMKRK